jgi:DUF4097 and DUF4098 domain-containing protein YvlB
MNLRVWVLGGLAVFALDASAAERRLDKAFNVSPDGTVRVDAQSANVTVKSSGNAQVRVQILFEGSSSTLEDLTLSAEASSQGVDVEAKHRGGGWRSWFNFGNWNRAEITISVPAQYNVDLKTSGGNIDIENVRGRATGSTSGGDIRVRSVAGPVRMHTSGGRIAVSDIQSETVVETSGGSIEASRISGSLNAETSGGSIHVSEVRGKVSASTSSGSVDARQIVGDVRLNSSGGSIRVEADGSIEADTSGGPIDVILQGTNRGISASTSGGGITIRVPTNTAASIDAATSGGSVTSDLPIARSSSEERSIKGTLNGGGPLIKARTSGGGIRIQSGM